MKDDLKPLDTSAVRLPPAIVQLTEFLARNTHALWVQKRRAEGWRLGPNRDDATRTTPLLVPYDQLPESEREYDRTIAMETLKAVVALGYRIVQAKEGEPTS